jgi:acetone carboxylase alpha subunit
MCGGYPAPTIQYHYALKGARLDDLLEKYAKIPRRPEVGGIGDAILEELGRDGKLEVIEGAYLGALEHGDLFSHSYNAGGGFGDPLDRDPQAVEADASRGLVSAAASKKIDGVVLQEVDGAPRVDHERTAARREQIRTERLARSVPVSEWLERERRRVEMGGFCDAVSAMYRECRELSPRWWSEFTGFWGLPAEFELPPTEPEE